MNKSDIPVAAIVCPQCGGEVAASLLSCPTCHALVHAGRLRQLAKEAEAVAFAGDYTKTLSIWRQALELLPPGTRQHEAVSAKIEAISEKVRASPISSPPAIPGGNAVNSPEAPEISAEPGEQAASSDHKSAWRKGAAGASAGAGVLAMLLSKFKLVTLLLSKGKLLITGLMKGKTFFSMFLSLGVYWAAWGWKFALGIVLSIYVHEMGHVAMLRRFGIKATAPMFIPGLGALIRLKQYPANPREDARVGLAGPTWGLGAAVVVYLVYLATGWESWAAIARVGAWINLFNLMPVWQLDGGRGFASMTRRQRWMAVIVIALMWVISHEGMLVLLLIFAVAKAFQRDAPERIDWPILGQYVFLVVALSAMCMIKLPIETQF